MNQDEHKRNCHAEGCILHVSGSYLMCNRHWFIVPASVRMAVLKHYRKGYAPSRDYQSAAAMAKEAVAKKEGRRP